jgi:hypothetical protein
MKLDDRDIICQQDYAPLSNAELLTQIEENLEWLRGAALFDTERVMGPVRALLARVEAAERDARNDLDDAELHLRRAEAAATVLVARVTELEAQLAAQQWRPVTEDWPPYNERVIIGHGGGYGGGWSAFARRVRTDNRDGDDWLMDDDTTLAFESAVVAMRRPLPPAPQETE